MRSIIGIESKRIIKSIMTIGFFVVVVMLSINSSYQAVDRYELWDSNGFVASGRENLKHGKENGSSIEIEEAIAALRKNDGAKYVDETNVEELLSLVYENKDVGELSDQEINLFLSNRLKIIKRRLEESTRFTYTEEEKEKFLGRAEFENLTIGYAEGWKTLNRDMGSFLPFVILLIALVIMPLFGNDPQNKMKELSCSTKNGKAKLVSARLISAFGIGSVFYLLSLICFFVIKMIPFGFHGGDNMIQSNPDMFFSTFPITFLEQFFINCFRGYAALIFVIALTILVSAITERIMVGSVILCFFWLLLFIMDKMMQFEVNHWFSNFMPLRLSGSIDFYTSNEVYRFCGNRFDSMVWCPAVSVFMAIVMLAISILWLNKEKMAICVSRKNFL